MARIDSKFQSTTLHGFEARPSLALNLRFNPLFHQALPSSAASFSRRAEERVRERERRISETIVVSRPRSRATKALNNGSRTNWFLSGLSGTMETPRNCATARIYIFMRGRWRGEGLAWNKASSFAACCSLAFNANLIVYVMFVNCRQASWCLKFDRRYYFEILNETWKISGWIYSFSDEITETKSSEQNLDTIFIKLSFVQGIIKKKNVYYNRFTFVNCSLKTSKTFE